MLLYSCVCDLLVNCALVYVSIRLVSFIMLLYTGVCELLGLLFSCICDVLVFIVLLYTSHIGHVSFIVLLSSCICDLIVLLCFSIRAYVTVLFHCALVYVRM